MMIGSEDKIGVKSGVVKPGNYQLTNEGFARRVDAELDSLGYVENHPIRVAARQRFTVPSGDANV